MSTSLIAAAIEMIEDNLTNPDLDIAFVCNKLYISSFHFQRVFYYLTRVNLGTYIRERQLTEAGRDLRKGERIIDTAIKYGYETQASFSKAFKKFHGFTPGEAKGRILGLTPKINYERISNKEIYMDIKIEKEDAFEIAIKVYDVKEKDSLTIVPQCWDDFMKKAYYRDVPPMLGVCLSSKVHPTKNGYFAYGIGSIKDYCKKIPQGFEILKVPAGTWAKFYTKGKMPEAIQKLWCEVVDKWLPSSGYKINRDFDFECYTEGNTASDDYVSGIWLKLEK